jgi:hypothetical protein
MKRTRELIQIRELSNQRPFKSWLKQPVASIVAISLIAGVLVSFHQVLELAIEHWEKPILFHDSLYLIRGKHETDLLAWLLKQHNEHRLIISKLASLTETSIGLVPGQSALIQSLVLLALCMFLWWKLCSHVLSNHTNRVITILGGWLVLLNPWQYENLTWEFQTPWFLINVIVLGGSVLLYRAAHSDRMPGSSINWCGVVAAALPWAALASSGQGIAFAVAFSASSWVVNRQMGWIVSGSSALGLISNFILLPYSKPNHHPELQFNLDFFLQIWLGGAWQGLALLAAVISGLMLWKSSRAMRQVDWPAIALPGLFSLLFAGMITLSRSAFGIDQADASRYVTHSLMLGLTALLALAYSLDDRRDKNSIPIGGFVILLITLASFPQRFTSTTALFDESWKQAREFAKSKRNSFVCHSEQIALQKQGIELDEKCKDDFANQHLMIERYMNDKTAVTPRGWHRKLLRPPIQLGYINNPNNLLQYHVDSKKIDGNNIRIEGWAFTAGNKSRKVGDQVFLLANYSDGHKLAFSVNRSRPDVQTSLQLNSDKVGFQALIPLRRRGYSLTSLWLAGRRQNRSIWENALVNG